MSKSVQDYTSFAAKINSERGISRQNNRLNVPKILRLFLVCLLFLALSPVSFAQVVINWGGANQGVAGYSEGGVLGNQGYVSGRAQGVNQGRPGYWEVQGNLGVNGRAVGVEFLSFLDVWGYLDVYNGHSIQNVTTISVGDFLYNTGTISNGNTDTGNSVGGSIYVTGDLFNNAHPGGAQGIIRNYETIFAGSLQNWGTIDTAGNLFVHVYGDIENGSNGDYARGSSVIQAGNDGNNWASIVSIYAGGNLTNWFDGAIRADVGNGMYGGTYYDSSLYISNYFQANGITVKGQLYNAGEISTYEEWATRLLRSGTVWTIEAGSIWNDGRLYSQFEMTEGKNNPYYWSGRDNQALGIILDAATINTVGHLRNQGANAIINGAVTTNTGKAMHVGGTLYNLDRASIFNYAEIVIHGDLENRGATLVGGHWFTHSYLTDNGEHPMIYQTGLINVWGNVSNTTEKAFGGREYGGLIASFDTFRVHGSLYNDANSMITGSYMHNGTGPWSMENHIIDGRRANMLSGVLLEGEMVDAASVLNVMGVFPSSETQPPFCGLYNAGHIREIDIIYVGSNEFGVLWNAYAETTPGATLPTSNGEARNDEGVVGTASTITDIGIINAANLINEGTISDIDMAINVSYSLYNTTTGRLDGLSLTHVEWTYAADGTPSPMIVSETTRADLRVGKASSLNQFVNEGIGIVNDGLITNFNNVSSQGTMYNYGVISNVTALTVGSGLDVQLSGSRASLYSAGTLSNVDSVNVSGDITFASGSMFTNVGTITAYNTIEVNGIVDGGFGVLSAKTGKLIVNGGLGIDRGAVAAGYEVENWGIIINEGVLNSATSILNEGGIVNNGTISAYSGVVNWGTISGNGMIFISQPGSKFKNETTGTIAGGLAVHGNFETVGHIRPTSPNDVIRVTSGTATVNGGTVTIDPVTYFQTPSPVPGQYLFMAADRPGDLVILKELTGSGNGVLDFNPVYGTWNGTNYVAGELWHKNQYYWLESSRRYTYGNIANSVNGNAIGNYLDKIGKVVVADNSPDGDYRNTGLWNLLAQLDTTRDPKPALRGQQDPNTLDSALRAMEELNGAIYATIGTTTVHNVGVVNNTLANTLRSDVFKFSFIGNPNNAIRGQAIAPLRYNRWGTVYGIGGSSKHDGNADGYDLSFGGIMAGIDRAFWTGTRLGAYLSVAGGDVSLKTLDERSKSTDVMLGMYMRQEMYYGYGLAAAGYGHNTYKTTRNLTTLGHTAESRTHGNIGSVYLERGMDIPVYYATVQPFTSFQVVSVHLDKFTEDMRNQYGYNANVGLDGVKGRTDSFKMGLGARASSQPIPFQWGQLAASMNMAWYHEFNGDNDRDFIAKFTNPGGCNFDAGLSDVTFRVVGNDPKRDWFNFGGGLHVDRNSTRFFVDANLYTNERQSLFTGNFGVSTSW